MRPYDSWAEADTPNLSPAGAELAEPSRFVVEMGSRDGFGSWLHLSQRFFSALLPFGPSPDHEAWALDHLVIGEQELFGIACGPDEHHAVGVAPTRIGLFDSDDVPREVTAAALLHDVGKVVASFGTFARVWITFAAIAVGRSRLVTWANRRQTAEEPSIRARVGLYLSHDRVGRGAPPGSRKSSADRVVGRRASSARGTLDHRSDRSAALKAADGD